MKIKLGTFIQTHSQYSRRQSRQLILDEKVFINGNCCTDPSQDVTKHKDRVTVDGTLIKAKSTLYYYLFNKPKGVISTLSDPKGRKNLKEFMIKEKIPTTVFPVGRLDRATTGLMIFTNDGDYANEILHPKFELTKTYRVTLDKSLTKRDLTRLVSGLILDDGPFKFNHIEQFEPKRYIVKLHEGRNRIIRRAFSSLDYDVIGLKRISIGNLLLQGIKEGKFKPFRP